MRDNKEHVETTCGFCEKEIIVCQWRIDRATATGKVFCSPKCKRKYYYYISGDKVGIEKYQYNSLPQDVRRMAVFIIRADQRKGLYSEHDLTIQYLHELWEAQKHKCAYTNIELRLPHNHHKKNNNSKIYTASLDRIDSNKGYVQGNVQFVSTAINYMKNDMTHEQTIELIKLIVSSCS